MSGIVDFFRRGKRQQDVFTELLRPHVELMYRMAYRWTQSSSDAEDLVQDILTRLATRVDELQRVDMLRPWLIKILYNRYVDLYRRQRNGPVAYEHEVWTPDEDALSSPVARAQDQRDPLGQMEDQRALLKGLAQLDEGQRDVVLLHDVEGYTALEVADILELNVGTVKSRLHRARAHLKKFLMAGTF
ncbi:RNA polymerase sigma factor [Marinimicrobium alkaliphilum]|uniref:RNA polymerase sigma factor n=1 Tax=Marinimicrobium alkaliphilum TaxID=2202654 RepID=UPI000DB9CC99|nr:RNA polymerase sigma factor [Marinimicrobium alkaliphilum]